VTGAPLPPLFTDFTYDNIGIPKNPLLADAPVDNGLGAFLETRPDLIPAGQPDAEPAAQYGKFKVATLRNVGISAPYGHNGYFPSLTEIVKFYNTRDVLTQNGAPAWPAPEQPLNMNNAELGNLGLTVDEEWDIVAFLLTLTDNMRNQ
jgi:cytochrome c peroxidase